MDSWKEFKLSEIMDLIGGGTPKTSNPDYWNGDIPWISVKDFNGDRRYVEETEKKISELGLKNSSTKILSKGDIIISARGTVGELAIIPSDMAFNQSCYGLRAKDFVNPTFLYYLLKESVNVLKHNTHGSVFDTITRDTFNGISINLPPLPTQQKIAQILSSLDDKIELNNKINANLEQQAQALFKSWFVDFEPFGGEMPAEWKVGKLSDVIETTINGDWGKDEPIGTNTEEVFCIRGADIPEVKIGNKGKMPTRYILPKNWNQKKLTDGDLVVEISGGSPTQSTGRVAYISNALLDRYNNKIICTNFCKAVKPHKNLSMYVYYLWQHLYNKDVFFNYENGTTGVKNLDMNGILMNEDIVIPSEDYLKKFNDFCSLVFKEIFANGNETEKLSNLRDTLLPKLMNGEIEV